MNLHGSFSERVVQAVHAIPAGRVASYGTIAAMAGKPRGSRGVIWILRSNKDPSLPWHRVVKQSGEIAIHDGTDLQRALLEAEGIIFSEGGRVPTKLYGITGISS